MKVHLLQSLQQFFGYPELQKIDPNTQEMKDIASPDYQYRFSQAVIPSVIVGLSKFLHTEQGWRLLQSGENYPNWGSRVFGRHNTELCKRIADYSDIRWEEVMHKVHEMLERAIWMVRNSGIKSAADMKLFIEAERNYALTYLPAKINLGELLGDDSLDDGTHKMQGPLSNLMKSLGNSFDSIEKNTDGHNEK